jgi:hypothetical protein
MKIPPMLLHAFTTADNTALDTIRIGMAVGGLSLIGLAAWAVIVNHQPFDALVFGGGLAAIFGGGGFGLAAKSRDEVTTQE